MTRSNKFRTLSPMLFVACVNPASAAADWTWQFTTPTLNIAETPLAHAVITNSLDSDTPIYVGGVSLFSLGDQGLLQQNDGGGPIVPTGYSVAKWLQPGESTEAVVLSFFVLANNMPRPGVYYEIRPTLSVFTGNNCVSPPSFATCAIIAQMPERSLVVTYAPVPEPHVLELLAVGSAAVLGAVRLKRG